jgi:hypothetical protein
MIRIFDRSGVESAVVLIPVGIDIDVKLLRSRLGAMSGVQEGLG